jgi:hypothetical protein
LDEPKLVSKGDFAGLVGVSAGRVSQLIKDGRLAGALVGEGRGARIDVAKAMALLDVGLDISQRIGLNGKARIVKAGSDAPPPEMPRPNTVDDELKREALVQRQAETRRVLRDEAERAGELVSAREARLATDKAVVKMVAAVDQMLVEAAAAMSAEWHMPKREALHLLRRIWREQRLKQSGEMAADAADLPSEAEMVLELQ